MEALRTALTSANRYPDEPQAALREAIAKAHRVTPQQVLLGCGSAELLKIITETFTSPSRHLVTAAPTYEAPTRIAKVIGTPIRELRVDDRLRLDLDGMVRESAGAGLVFYCNPNNPTGTIYGAAETRSFIDQVLARSPETTILVDEAYFEYVDDRAYETMIPLAIRNPRIIVTRTFSKVYGIAGLRAGYAIAHEETIAKVEPRRLSNGVGFLGAAAALASLPLADHVVRERNLNAAARDYTVRFFNDNGFKCATTSTNFVMFDIGRDAKKFGEECLKRGVSIGRQFPPLLNYARISIGTMDEMQRALPIIRETLKATKTDAG
jgi:histidinol-phosphate aminotransferase